MPVQHSSPLAEQHTALGAKLADFGGWQMPIEYPAASGGGVLREHAAVRETVGVFDVSHLGKISVRGTGARDFVNDCLTNDLGRIDVGKAQNTLCCDDVTGGVLDDVIAYLVSDDEVFLVPNAANTATVARTLTAAAPATIHIDDRHLDFGVLAVQGQQSARVLEQAGLPAELDYMSFVDVDRAGQPVRVCRTGYTGEHGYELIVGWSATAQLWDELLGHITEAGGLPAGLGARDTLRTEMGYPLHGQDLSPDITPVQARLGWAVGWQKPAFWGREVLLAERAEGAHRLLRGVALRERGIPRPGMAVFAGDGQHVGDVTSGTFSPTRKIGIALALLRSDVAIGDEVQLDIRGRRIAGEVVAPPFVPSHVR